MLIAQVARRRASKMREMRAWARAATRAVTNLKRGGQAAAVAAAAARACEAKR